MEPGAPAEPGTPGSLPTGPHPVIGPRTVRMPRWPGPVMAIGGGLALLAALVAAELERQGELVIRNPEILLGLLVGGGILVLAGLLWAAIRQIRVRAYLPPERYRGPSIFLLLAFVLIVSSVIVVPVAADALVIGLGEGDLTLVGAIVVLLSTPVALLVVTGVFVVWPRALAGVRVPGPDTPGAIVAGVSWGIGAWLLASIVSVIVVYLLEAAGIEAVPQTAARALDVIDPWLAVVAIVVAAPIAEEIFFRGVVFNAWLREGGRRIAYVGSALLFAVIHLSLTVLVPIILLGLILAWVYDRTRNIVAPIVLHATFNGINVALFLLVDAGVLDLPV